ncbi:MAG: site-2 protease family protein [Clostridiales bacterium]|jgi:regulator of sigma E protease|nr:site-2 protease family protein [Clostridiales bacterium]
MLEILRIAGYVVLAFVCLSVMVVIHELGHFIAGRKLGFKVNEFAIGMGPKIISRKLKKSGLILSWRILPIGGFCSFEGEDDAENPAMGAFNNQKPWKRLIVLFAGVFTNFLSAIIVLSLFFTFSGQRLPQIAPSEYGGAAEFGVEAGDVVVKVEGRRLQMLETSDFTNLLAGKDEVNITVMRGVKTYDITLIRHAVPDVDEEGNIIPGQSQERFGINVGETQQTFGFFESIVRAARFSFFTAVKILSALGSMITGSANVADTAGGPVTMVSGLTSVVSTGIANTIYIVCLFSVNLAIFNILPLPALDGGRMVFTIIEWIRKKPLKKGVEAMIHFVGLVALLGMAILFDIIHFINAL